MEYIFRGKMNIVQNRKQAKTVDIKTKRRTEERLKQQLKKEENSTTKLIACYIHYSTV